jgi:predicted Zn-dependent protease
VINITPLKQDTNMSFSPLFQLLGEPAKSASTAVVSVLSIDDIDEVEFGHKISQQFYISNTRDTKTSKYLTQLLKKITVHAKRKMNYQVFIQKSIYPNAYALPGGTIIVTSGLLNVLQSESELVAVLAHEMGHIEQSHCLNNIKYRIAADKIGLKNIGKIVDMASHLLIRHAYKKTQENEADVYAFELMTHTSYDPNGVYLAFKHIYDYYKMAERKQHQSSIIKDYFLSHPKFEDRIGQFKVKSTRWWKLNPGARRYVGKRNINEKTSFFTTAYRTEWVTTKYISKN